MDRWRFDQLTRALATHVSRPRPTGPVLNADTCGHTEGHIRRGGKESDSPSAETCAGDHPSTWVSTTPAPSRSAAKILSMPRQLARLTPREQELAALVARGLRNREIAAALVLSERTVHAHVRNILNKLGLTSRAEIAVWSIQHGSLEGSSLQSGAGLKSAAGS